MLELNGFKAWISVDSAELEQYDINLSGDSNTITCWIPSEAGKVLGYFSILCKNDSYSQSTKEFYSEMEGHVCTRHNDWRNVVD